MIHIDWDDLQLTDAELTRAVESIREIPVGPRDVLTVRRVIHGYQVVFSRPSRGYGTELRIHGSDLTRVLERARELATVVATAEPRRTLDKHTTEGRACRDDGMRGDPAR